MLLDKPIQCDQVTKLSCTITGTCMYLLAGKSNKMFFGCVFLVRRGEHVLKMERIAVFYFRLIKF